MSFGQFQQISQGNAQPLCIKSVGQAHFLVEFLLSFLSELLALRVCCSHRFRFLHLGVIIFIAAALKFFFKIRVVLERVLIAGRQSPFLRGLFTVGLGGSTDHFLLGRFNRDTDEVIRAVDQGVLLPLPGRDASSVELNTALTLGGALVVLGTNPEK